MSIAAKLNLRIDEDSTFTATIERVQNDHLLFDYTNFMINMISRSSTDNTTTDYQFRLSEVPDECVVRVASADQPITGGYILNFEALGKFTLNALAGDVSDGGSLYGTGSFDFGGGAYTLEIIPVVWTTITDTFNIDVSANTITDADTNNAFAGVAAGDFIRLIDSANGNDGTYKVLSNTSDDVLTLTTTSALRGTTSNADAATVRYLTPTAADEYLDDQTIRLLYGSVTINRENVWAIS